MSKNWGDILACEFAAEEGSFLLQLRCDMTWDKAAFSRLTDAMLTCCQVYTVNDWQPPLPGMEPTSEKSMLPRWLAEGFWFLPIFVKGHTSHEAWREKIARDSCYYERAYQRLEDLADWFFTGACPSLDPERAFSPM